ncbi:hypothetical protein JCM8097_004430 [Rhodosporidiobolus ruineniae]
MFFFLVPSPSTLVNAAKSVGSFAAEQQFKCTVAVASLAAQKVLSQDQRAYLSQHGLPELHARLPTRLAAHLPSTAAPAPPAAPIPPTSTSKPLPAKRKVAIVEGGFRRPSTPLALPRQRVVAAPAVVLREHSLLRLVEQSKTTPPRPIAAAPKPATSASPLPRDSPRTARPSTRARIVEITHPLRSDAYVCKKAALLSLLLRHRRALNASSAFATVKAHCERLIELEEPYEMRLDEARRRSRTPVDVVARKKCVEQRVTRWMEEYLKSSALAASAPVTRSSTFTPPGPSPLSRSSASPSSSTFSSAAPSSTAPRAVASTLRHRLLSRAGLNSWRNLKIAALRREAAERGVLTEKEVDAVLLKVLRRA